ncbi:MAG: DUF308 domain-containing protein [Candidatus Kariarchaeaceae archaeon]|jgi:uncharacterized membrane protein HdeD (DUF308 family)
MDSDNSSYDAEKAKVEAEKAKKDQQKKAEKQVADTRKQEEKEEKKAMTKQKRIPYKLPLYMRLFNLVVGLLFIGASLFALAYEELTVVNTVLILAALLGISGVLRMLNAFYEKDIGGTSRLIRFLIGAFLVVVGVLIILDFGFGEDILYLLLAISLFLLGGSRILVAVRHKAYPRMIKLIHMVLGAALILISVAAVLPQYTPVELPVDIITMIVLGFFVNGISRFITGLYGINENRKKV